MDFHVGTFKIGPDVFNFVHYKQKYLNVFFSHFNFVSLFTKAIFKKKTLINLLTCLNYDFFER